MKNKQRMGLIASAASFVLIAGWLGASIYVGQQVDAKMQQMVQAGGESGRHRLRNLQHQSGLLSSSGKVEILLLDACDTATDKPEWFKAEITYKLSHLITPASLLRGEWSMTPVGGAKTGFEEVFGNEAALQGKGRVLFSGALHSDLNLPAFQIKKSGETLLVSPSVGAISLGKNTLALDWKTANMTYRGGGMAMEIQGFSVASDLTDRKRGLGQLSLNIDKFGNPVASAEGMRLEMAVTENNDRLDMRITPGMKSLHAGGKQFSDLLLELVFNGMHAKSIEYLIDLSEKSCNFQNLTQDETTQMRESVRRLVFSGLSMGVQRLAGKVDGAELDGKLIVELAKTEGPSFSLEKVLRSYGQLSLTGAGIKPEDKKMLMSMGIANETPKGLKASFDYAAGILKTNDQVFDTTVFSNFFDGANAAVNAFLSGRPARAAQTAVPEVIEPEDEDTVEDEESVNSASNEV